MPSSFGPIHDELIRQQALRTRLPQRPMAVEKPSHLAPAPTSSRAAWVRWVEHTIHPIGFVTIVMTPRAGRLDGPTSVADAMAYLRDITRLAEQILWGRASRHRAMKTQDWCAWVGTHHHAPYPSAIMTGTFLHFSLLVRLRLEPMRVEQHASMLPVASRLARLQEAVLRASDSVTHLPNRANRTRENLLADVDGKPYATAHAEALYGELGPHASVGDAVRGGRLVVLPGTTTLHALERRAT